MYFPMRIILGIYALYSLGEHTVYSISKHTYMHTHIYARFAFKCVTVLQKYRLLSRLTVLRNKQSIYRKDCATIDINEFVRFFFAALMCELNLTVQQIDLDTILVKIRLHCGTLSISILCLVMLASHVVTLNDTPRILLFTRLMLFIYTKF